MNATPTTPDDANNPTSTELTSTNSYAQLLREYAIWVVRVLSSRNYIAYFAGGCVRDEIMGSTPSDFDVATNATPEQVQELFGRQKSLMIGAAFGVVCVHDRRNGESVQIEVATFRSDGAYIDGRRPESVAYTSPEMDAQRRDFTINGIFYDPIQEAIIDFVGGQTDIQSGIIRAIGDPFQRFAEDRLRLLRAIRFASRFGFSIEANTWRAICAMADRIVEVSAERIAMEVRKMLAFGPGRCLSFSLLHQSGLLRSIFPEAANLLDSSSRVQSLERLNCLKPSNWVVGIVAVLWDFFRDGVLEATSMAETLKERWHLSNDEEQELRFVIAAQEWLLVANTAPWSRLQPLLLSNHFESALSLTEAILATESSAADSFAPRAEDGSKTKSMMHALKALREKREQDREVWNPRPLVNGRMLIELKVPSGPEFAKLIHMGRDAQLDGIIHTEDEARRWLRKQLQTSYNDTSQ